MSYDNPSQHDTDPYIQASFDKLSRIFGIDPYSLSPEDRANLTGQAINLLNHSALLDLFIKSVGKPGQIEDFDKYNNSLRILLIAIKQIHDFKKWPKVKDLFLEHLEFTPPKLVDLALSILLEYANDEASSGPYGMGKRVAVYKIKKIVEGQIHLVLDDHQLKELNQLLLNFANMEKISTARPEPATPIQTIRDNIRNRLLEQTQKVNPFKAPAGDSLKVGSMQINLPSYLTL